MGLVHHISASDQLISISNRKYILIRSEPLFFFSNEKPVYERVLADGDS